MRKRLVLATVVLAASTGVAERPSSPGLEIANVAAFARLYGVARYFYPSDSAAELDWNRFAVHGVSRSLDAADQASLRNTLLRLFAPLGPGFEVSPRLPAAVVATGEGPLVAWRAFGPGFPGNDTAGPYRGKRTNRAAPPAPIDGFVGYVQRVPAEALRGRTIRLGARARATTTPEPGGGAIGLRIDRRDGSIAFLDNMMDRPVRDAAWRPCTIETTVPADAFSLVLGPMAYGVATADFDALELSVKAPDGSFSPVSPAPIRDAGFEEPGEAKPASWTRTGTSRTAIVSRPESDAPEGRRFLRLAPPPREAAAEELIPDTPPQRGAHVDVDLGSGLAARVPLALSDAEARTDPARRSSIDALAASIAAVPEASPGPGPEQRLADVVVAWSTFRHFYPYWAESGVEWEARLVPALEEARAASTRAAQRDALRRLVAGARDGHGSVADLLDQRRFGFLPVAFALLGGRLVVAASSTPDAPAGAVVSSLDGVPAARRVADLVRLQSGSDRWREVKVAGELGLGPRGARVTLELDSGTGSRSVPLAFDGEQPPLEKRPEPVVEIEPETWYVDLTRAAMGKIESVLEDVAKARGVVFDLRGYPLDAGMKILPHLLDAPESDRWMHVPRIVGPFLATAGWNSFGWNVAPAKPRVGGKVVFLTDARAISYAESVMGYVADRKLGTIVGSPTAGTNGNVATIRTPGGFVVAFTGMRVTGHDGRSPFHLVGVKPDVPVTPTVEGLRAGRDEVLERGLAVARGASR